MNVAVNDFVKRQVKGSGKTYAKTLNFEEIAYHAEKQMYKKCYTNGYRDGIRLVTASEKIASDFVCPYVKLDHNVKLKSKIVKRRSNEEFYIQTRAINGTCVPTGKVQLVLYSHEVLLENDEHSTEADWELISMNAIPFGLSSMPMGPITMMRNQLGLIGGTKAHYKSKDWANSVRFWQKYVPLDSDNSIP